MTCALYCRGALCEAVNVNIVATRSFVSGVGQVTFPLE